MGKPTICMGENKDADLLSKSKISRLFAYLYLFLTVFCDCTKVQVGKDQEKAQSERDSHSKNRGGKKPN